METTHGSFEQLASISKQIVRQLATIGENRLELLTVEVQEERERRVANRPQVGLHPMAAKGAADYAHTMKGII